MKSQSGARSQTPADAARVPTYPSTGLPLASFALSIVPTLSSRLSRSPPGVFASNTRAPTPGSPMASQKREVIST